MARRSLATQKTYNTVGSRLLLLQGLRYLQVPLAAQSKTLAHRERGSKPQ